jgi:hypothetical protein
MSTDLHDPRTPQRRLAVSPSGAQVWVEVTSGDRLKIIAELPSRWPEVIKARERGESLESIARWAKCPPPCEPTCRLVDDTHDGPACLSYLVAECYAHIETRLADLAATRARLYP